MNNQTRNVEQNDIFKNKKIKSLETAERRKKNVKKFAMES